MLGLGKSANYKGEPTKGNHSESSQTDQLLNKAVALKSVNVNLAVLAADSNLTSAWADASALLGNNDTRQDMT